MEALFHIPGLRYNFPLNMLLIDMLERFPKYFREGVKISSVFGDFPASLWSSGRYSAGDQCAREYVTGVVGAINAKNVAVDILIPIRLSQKLILRTSTAISALIRSILKRR
jgi:hypothetical protein